MTMTIHIFDELSPGYHAVRLAAQLAEQRVRLERLAGAGASAVPPVPASADRARDRALSHVRPSYAA